LLHDNRRLPHDNVGRRLFHHDVGRRRVDHHVALRTAYVVDVVGIVVRCPAHPHSSVERWQDGNDDPERRGHDYEAGTPIGTIPDAIGEEELHPTVKHSVIARRQHPEGEPAGRIVVVVMVPRVQELTLPKLVFVKLMLAKAPLVRARHLNNAGPQCQQEPKHYRPACSEQLRHYKIPPLDSDVHPYGALP
jgi:hypothetical protein